MESVNKNLLQQSIDPRDVNLAAARGRYQRLILVFKFFFFLITLIIGALIIYLVRDAASDSESVRSIHQNYPTDQTFNPVVNSEFQIFDTETLERAAEQLEDVASSILLKYLGSNTDTTTQFALKMCRISLLNGSGQIRRALEVNRVITMDQILRVEDSSIRACLDDLEKVESTAVSEVIAKVLRAKAYLRDRGDFLVSNDEKNWEKKVSNTIAANWALFLENSLFLVCVGGLQLSFLIYLLWAVLKFR